MKSLFAHLRAALALHREPGFQVSLRAMSVLAWLAMVNRTVQVREIAAVVEASTTTVTSICDQLEAAKFIDRHTCTQDRRAVNVCLTEHGRLALLSLVARVEQEMHNPELEGLGA